MAQAAQTNSSTQQELEKILKLKDAEINLLKEKLAAMELDVAQAQKLKTQRAKENEEVQALKIQSEGILTKAKAMIFENTKVIKNQELQLEALGQQNDSLKDVVSITKDLLEIRNLEVKQLEGKIQCMEDRVKAEKTRQDLLHKKLETMIRHNGELKREYEAQLCLFNALRERYSEKELAQGVVADLRRDVAETKAEQPNVSENGNASTLVNEVVKDQTDEAANQCQTTSVDTPCQNNKKIANQGDSKVVKTQTNEVAEVQTSEVDKNQSNVVAESQTINVTEIQTNVVGNSQTSKVFDEMVVAQGQPIEVAKNQTNVVAEIQTNVVAKGQSSEVADNQTKLSDESQNKAEGKDEKNPA